MRSGMLRHAATRPLGVCRAGAVQEWDTGCDKEGGQKGERGGHERGRAGTVKIGSDDEECMGEYVQTSAGLASIRRVAGRLSRKSRNNKNGNGERGRRADSRSAQTA